MPDNPTRTKVLLTSSIPSQEVQSALEKASVRPDAFIKKPFDLMQLVKAIRGLLGLYTETGELKPSSQGLATGFEPPDTFHLVAAQGWLELGNHVEVNEGPREAVVIQPLEAPDSIRLQAAEGWIGLGDYHAATEELEQITAANRVHPDVLQLRWRVYAEAKEWDACLDIATALTTLTPERRFGWLHRAHSLDKLGRTQEAKDLLLAVAKDFESNSTIPFHLARYCCGLGQSQEALAWLEKAVAAANDPEALLRLRGQILEDPALEPLRHKL